MKYKGDRDVIDDFLHVCEHVVESRLAHTILKDELEKSRVFIALRKGTAKSHFIVDGSGQPGMLLANSWGGHSSLNEFEQLKTFYTLLVIFEITFFMGQSHSWSNLMSN